MADSSTRKRRKWDQGGDEEASPEPINKVAKTEEEVEQVNEEEDEKTIDPIKAASLAAAKINAIYSIKPANGSENKKTNDYTSSSSIPAPPMSNKSEFSKKIEINDLKNRYMLTRGATQTEIAQQTGAEITTRGKYYPDPNLATEKEPPLYLYITAADQESLDKAIEEVNKLIESASALSSSHLNEGIRKRPISNQDDDNDDSPNINNGNNYNNNYNNNMNNNGRPPFERPQRKFYDENIEVDIPEGPTYNLRAKIVGPQGAYVKHITNVTGCRIQVRGRGSGFIEHDTGMEADVPLYIHISTPREEMLPRAVQLAKDLIATIKTDVEKQPQNMGYNRGYHNYQNYDYQGYSAPTDSTNASSVAPSNENYAAYDYSQYGYYGQQQYDPNYYGQYYQQPPPPPPQPQDQPSSSDPPPPTTSSPTPPSETGHTGYNSVPPPPQY